tara:strand:- start:2055 stop:2225 length:171 start_codon:yes stop_codon:yes gene_type:complete
MTQAQAQLELIKLNKTIETKIVQHKNELGQHNKNCVENELMRLWWKKSILQNIANQ